MAMDLSAQPSRQEIMCSQSETLESMLVCRKSNQEKAKARPAADEQALKCPRCDSTNTKFCYYNNYSLTQPRYFCKSCRRYWTKGGTLRNIPVGGGCRKNKRSSSSSSSSKSRTTMHDHHQPMIMKADKDIPLTSDYAQMGLDHGHDWNINPNIPLISGNHGVIGAGAGLFDALRGTGLFLDQTPSRGFGHDMHGYGLTGQEMGIIDHVGFEEELMGGGGAVVFPWQMMTSYGGNGGDGLELSWINGISGHGLLNTPLM